MDIHFDRRVKAASADFGEADASTFEPWTRSYKRAGTRRLVVRRTWKSR
jgi:hypothetical protein